MSQRDAHILRALISIQNSWSPDENNLRQALKEIITYAKPPPEAPQGFEAVGLNDVVTVCNPSAPDEVDTFEIVLPQMSNPDAGKISVLAPMSLGVLGRRAGDQVTVTTPEGPAFFNILEIQKA